MPRPRPLKNKPLVEAILEVHWNLTPGPAEGMMRDPNYKFLLGKLFESVKPLFPYHEELPVASVPDELTPFVVHHRFRTAPNGWPLIQVGPGVFTVNETSGYVWESFENILKDALPRLVAAHPKPDDLRFNLLLLRFVNAISLDPTQTNLLGYLAEKMRTFISLPAEIFSQDKLDKNPSRLATEIEFACSGPPGTLVVKLNTGKHNSESALIFELAFSSKDTQVPSMPDGFDAWLSSAHDVIETTFFTLIEGPLEKEFSADA
jgi:uncharacterized protein (TIGR04255 family)